MVRNYVKNKDTGPKYTDEKLNIALNDIMSGVLTTHKASVIYVELALAKEITIIKLPAHTSDLLQPLDVSVFKSFKQKWDKTVASFQRQNIGQRLPKSLFSQFLGETWLISLERWEKRQKETQDTAQDNIAFVEDVEYAEHNVNAPSPSISSSSAFEEVTPATTNLENQPDFTSPPLDPKEKITSEVQNQTVTSLEQMILATIQQKHPSNKQKKRKVASGAEIVKKIKTNEKRKKKIQCLDSDSSSTDAGLEDEVTYANSDESMWMEEENESNQESNNEKSISEIDSPTGEEDKENEVEEAKSQSIDIKKWETSMAKTKTKKTEEKLAQARLHKRKNYEVIKNDPEKYAIQKEKERQRYLKRKEQNKIKSVAKMTPREKRLQRKK
ncbi:unnamed protein product [Arctia plantaginis]|uniref:DDE-1 domain-containing protein n=1 Tax=Arctia plantaginis TaxID=874455 RepID=A0A8S0ZHR2_ARCPL|nr:unnamed protein product [Arctia plantaginis]